MSGKADPPARPAGGAGQADDRALVVFHGEAARWWQRLLRPGFCHCFAAVARDGYWIGFDTRRGLVELRVLCAAEFDLAAFYRAHGFTVAEFRRGARPPHAPLMPATCVGAVKRLLAIRAPLALTPWGLYRRLR